MLRLSLRRSGQARVLLARALNSRIERGARNLAPHFCEGVARRFEVVTIELCEERPHPRVVRRRALARDNERDIGPSRVAEAGGGKGE